MFVKPDWVFGFMTYHPHVPGGDEHPHNSRIKNRKMVDDAIENASPGFAGDRKYDAQLVADDLADK